MGTRMDYFDSPEQAAEYATLALTQMRWLKIAPTPRNFRVWYEYASGRNPALRAALDVLISNKRDISPGVIDDIYLQFFTAHRDTDRLREISAKLESSVSEVIRTVGDAETGNAQFGSALTGFSSELQTALLNGTLQNLVADIVNETKAMARLNADLEIRLQSSSSEIGQLKTNLEAIRHEAMTDPLTALANRKFFDEALTECARQAMEDGTELCLLMLDIDHFKRFNDQWGHQVGDQVLKLVSRTLRENARGAAINARYGGEEFAVILPGISLEESVSAADRIRESLMGKQLVKKSTGQSMGTITASIGAARFEAGEAVTNLIRRADEALYMAKRDGRNRVVAQDALDRLLAVAS
jgi:diguanylate cyclase